MIYIESKQIIMLLLKIPTCFDQRNKETMSLKNEHNFVVSKETWDSHNKMMLEPLSVSDSEVCVQSQKNRSANAV